MLPRDIRDVALEKAHLAPACLGPVRIERLSWIAPLWRPLLNSLCKTVPVEWGAPEGADAAWFSGTLTRIPKLDGTATLDLMSCADPHHEVVESLRWVRNLISSGAARPGDIALAAAHPEAWDEHFLALAADTGIRIHFSHGVPALSTRDGQRCAALADLLLRGLSEARVRRLVTLCHREGGVVGSLPSNWLAALPRGATLLTLGDWQRACEGMVVDGQPFDAKAILLPWLATLESGPGAARDAAAATLVGRTRRIWDAATRSAPAHAIELTLQNIRLPAETDAGEFGRLGAGSTPRVVAKDPRASAWPDEPLMAPAWQRGSDPSRPSCAGTGPRSRSGTGSRSPQLRGDQCVGGRGAGALAQPAQPARKPRWTEPVATTRPRGAHPVTGPNSRACVQRSGQAHGPSGGIRKRAIIASPSQCWRNWHSESFTAHDGRYGADHGSSPAPLPEPSRRHRCNCCCAGRWASSGSTRSAGAHRRICNSP